MTALLSYAHKRRQIAVGLHGVELGLDTVVGVVFARARENGGRSWMPSGQVFVEVWTAGEPQAVWEAIMKVQRMQGGKFAGVAVVPQVHPVARWPWSWARWRAWWRWQVRARR